MLFRSILFYGPPGVGKTTLAARLAEKMDGRLLVAHTDILDSPRGRVIFEGLIEIVDPTVILLDDLDRMWNPAVMLADLEQFSRKTSTRMRLLIGTVNCLGDIPEPMRRPGRFDEIIEFTMPDTKAREEILRTYAGSFGTLLSDKETEQLAVMCDGMSGAYLKEIALRASILDFGRIKDQVTQMKRLCDIADEESVVEIDAPKPRRRRSKRNSSPSSRAVNGLVKKLKKKGWRAKPPKNEEE